MEVVDNYLEKSSSVALSPEEEVSVNKCLLYKQMYSSLWFLTSIPALHGELANQLHSLALLALLILADVCGDENSKQLSEQHILCSTDIMALRDSHSILNGTNGSL